MIGAFNPSAFQGSPRAFQIASGPQPGPPEPFDSPSSGPNVDPRHIREYWEKLQKPQKEERKPEHDKEDIRNLVRKAYNKALGIPEPVEDIEAAPDVVLPLPNMAKVVDEVLAEVARLNMEATRRQVEKLLRQRQREAIAQAERQEHERRINIILASDAEDDAHIDAVLDSAASLMDEVRKMLN